MKALELMEYSRLAQRTSNDGHDRIENGMFGLLGETGEIADLYKKWKFQSVEGTQMPRARFEDEAGDVLWYLAELAVGMGEPLERIMAAESFRDIDHLVAQRSRRMHGNDARNVILAMAGNASVICRDASRSEWRMVRAHMRKMMIAIGVLMQICGSSLEDAARGNIRKLEKRYPKGFDAEISMRRYEE